MRVTGRIAQILVIEAYLGFTINALANLLIIGFTRNLIEAYLNFMVFTHGLSCILCNKKNETLDSLNKKKLRLSLDMTQKKKKKKEKKKREGYLKV